MKNLLLLFLLFSFTSVMAQNVYFGDKTTCVIEITKAEALDVEELIVKKSYCKEVSVASFKMSAEIKGKVVELKATSKITKDMKTLINALQPGEKFYLEAITINCTWQNGDEHQTVKTDMVFQIK